MEIFVEKALENSVKMSVDVIELAVEVEAVETSVDITEDPLGTTCRDFCSRYRLLEIIDMRYVQYRISPAIVPEFSTRYPRGIS